MLKYIALLALPLCACASTVPPVAPPRVVPLPTVEFAPAVSSENLVPSVFSTELPGHQDAQVMRCSSQLDCMQKLTGYCPNGYQGGQLLYSGDKVVGGALFKCITDEEVVAQKAQEAEYQAEIARERAHSAQREQDAQQKTTKHNK